MKALAILAVLPLAACGSTGSADLAKQALGNLEHCRRSYTAVVGALGVPGGSLNIECPAKPFPAEPAS